MPPPVRITRTEQSEAIKRIADRWVPHGDLPADEMTSNGEVSVPAVLADLRKHHRDAEQWMLKADAADALLLTIALEWGHRRQELFWLEAGRRLGLPRVQLSEPLGLGTHLRREDGNPRQGLRDRVSALRALLEFDNFDDELARDVRRLALEGGDDPRMSWLHVHRAEVVKVAVDLLAAAERHGVRSDVWFEELQADVQDDCLRPGSMAVLGLVTAAIRTSRAVVELTTTHNVHRVLCAADLLRCRFSGASVRRDQPTKPSLTLEGLSGSWQYTPPRSKQFGPADVDGRHHTDLGRELALIVARRAKVDDPDRWRLPSPDDVINPSEVLAYLANHRRGIERWVLQHEVPQALAFHVAEWWSIKAEEAAWLQAARQRGWFLTQIGAPFGIETRKGVLDRIDRRVALVERGFPDATLVRTARSVNNDVPLLDLRKAWIRTHADEIHSMIRTLVDAAERAQIVDRESLDDIAGDHRRCGCRRALNVQPEGERPCDVVSPSTMIAMTWAIEELEDLSTDQGLQSALARASALCGAFLSVHSGR